MKPLKWAVGGVALVIGVAHIGVLGHLMRLSEEPNLPVIPLPQVGENSSYTIRATPNGYEIEYRGDDPTVMTEETETDESNGLFGIGGRSNTVTTREYTRDGQRRPGSVDDEGKLSAEEIACLEAAGSGRGSGALVGGSIASGVVVPAVIGIPYIGWLAAGWATLLGTEIGGDAGAGIATTFRGC